MSLFLPDILTFPEREAKEEQTSNERSTDTRSTSDSTKIGLKRASTGRDKDTKPTIIREDYAGEPVSCIPKLIALDPDLVREQERKKRKLRQSLQ